MPGPAASKPGDIVYAMNGKSIEIDNTDAERWLVLSDAIYYTSTTFKPHTLIDIATLTGAMVIALGEHFSGVSSTSDTFWEELHAAGEHEYDRFWRMPLDDESDRRFIHRMRTCVILEEGQVEVVRLHFSSRRWWMGLRRWMAKSRACDGRTSISPVLWKR